jgi:hypothetical protein
MRKIIGKSSVLDFVFDGCEATCIYNEKRDRFLLEIDGLKEGKGRAAFLWLI